MVAAIVLAFMAAALVISGQLPSGGGPGTSIGQEQPLVSIFDHALKIATLPLAPFNRDTSTKSVK